MPEEPQRKGPTERPMSTVAWLIFFFVMLIPVLNVVIILICAFGPVNLNIKYFCRAILIWLFLGTLIVGAVGYFAFNAYKNSMSHEETLQLIDDAHKKLDTIKDSLQQQWKEEGKAADQK